MPVYVDPLHSVIGKSAPLCFKKAGKACHLFADTLEELHSFAERLGMKRAWFQNHPVVQHYDLVPTRRMYAVCLGAIELSTKETATKWLEIRSKK